MWTLFQWWGKRQLQQDGRSTQLLHKVSMVETFFSVSFLLILLSIDFFLFRQNHIRSTIYHRWWKKPKKLLQQTSSFWTTSAEPETMRTNSADDFLSQTAPPSFIYMPYISVAMLCFSWHIQVCRVLYLNMSVVWKHNSMEVWLQWLIFHWRPYISVKTLMNYSAPSFVFVHQSTGVLSTFLSTGLVSKWALSHAVWSTHRY